jgi:diacylglycerol kinase (ATP)
MGSQQFDIDHAPSLAAPVTGERPGPGPRREPGCPRPLRYSGRMIRVRRHRPRAAVVFNPAKIDRSRLNRVVEWEAERAGWGSTIWLETDPDDAGLAATRRALDEGARMLVVAGGDGTVRAVAEAAADSGVPIALVPVGTGNVLARNLHLPLSGVETAVRIAFTGRSRPIDVGQARIRRADGADETRVFMVMAGLGLDAAIMVSTNSRFKRLFGWVAYVTGALRAVNRFQRFRAAITVDGEAGARTRSHTVMVCNCGQLPGGLLLVPDARVDDGGLDMLAISPRRAIDWLGLWHRIMVEHRLSRSRAGQRLVELGGTRRLATLSHATGASVDVRVERPVACELDGDVFGEAVALRTRVLPGALLVRMPQEA